MDAKTSVLFLLALLMMIPCAGATTASRNCSDSYAWTNTTWVINNTNYPVNSMPVFCPYGCAPDGLDCAEPAQNDSGMTLAIGIILALVAFLFAYLAKNLEWGGEKYSWPLQTLFIFSSLLFIIIDVALIAGFNVFTQINISAILGMGYMSVIFIFMVCLLFFMVLLVIKAVEWLQQKRGKNAKVKAD